MIRRFILNADDYAMDAAVDGAIEHLVHRGTITSTSAMVLSPRWPEAGRRLRDIAVDRGLHLDLTSGFASAIFPRRPLPALIIAAMSRQLDPETVRTAIQWQLDCFETVMASPPRFVDGHHHVHHLPIVREALIDALEARYGKEAKSISLRSCLSRRWRGLKAAIITATGAWGLTKLASRFGYHLNTDFIGVNDFSRAADLSALWRKWLTTMVGEEPLAMCHVALNQASMADDEIWGARIREFEWLSSQKFRDLCHELSVVPAPWQSV